MINPFRKTKPAPPPPPPVADRDGFSEADDGDHPERRKLVKDLLGKDTEEFEKRDVDLKSSSRLSAVSAQYREQVTKGLAAGRTFTRGASATAAAPPPEDDLSTPEGRKRKREKMQAAAKAAREAAKEAAREARAAKEAAKEAAKG